MATRGCVAVGDERNWRGVYNRFDSYPTYLGRNLADELRLWLKDLRKTLREFCNELLKYTDWEEFKSGGVCPYCGKIGRGAPYKISAYIFFAGHPDRDFIAAEVEKLKERDDPVSKEILGNIEKTGFPDPKCKWHKHIFDDNKSSVERHHITSEWPDPIFIEWVYIINPRKETIIVLHHVFDPRYTDLSIDKVREEPIKRKEWWDYGHCRCKHFKVAEVSVRDAIEARVDWEIIEEVAKNLRKGIEDSLAKQPKDEVVSERSSWWRSS